MDGRYYQGIKHKPPMEHIKAGLRGERETNIIKYLRHYILSTPWVADYWRE